MVQPEHAGAVNVRIQHDLTVDFADPEVAEPSATVGLAGGGDCSVVSAHDIPDL
jgi:hypothetical protein